VNVEQAGGISRSLLAFSNEADNLFLLRQRQFRSASANAPFKAGQIQTRLRAFPQHGAFKFCEGPRVAHPGILNLKGCVSIRLSRIETISLRLLVITSLLVQVEERK
jgi:hypothetical protein